MKYVKPEVDGGRVPGVTRMWVGRQRSISRSEVSSLEGSVNWWLSALRCEGFQDVILRRR